ncbi:hypothetical protein ACFY12_04675 [Streptomyces sp. NPDC001339]|uniref:hypothetical protein n=1 Tax=Streptomyces sp. NPDC001339 TaxID=3364563 RepID=UPI00367AE62D
MPDDYFGRLLARYAPERPGAPSADRSADPFAAASDGRTYGTDGRADGDGAARRTLVRPRLPGPFERIEALRGASGEPGVPDAPAPPSPRAAWSPPFDGERIRYEREIRTTERERRTTVLRGEEAPRGAADGLIGPAVRPAAPLLRPAASVEPGPRRAASEAVRPRRPGAGAEDSGPGAGARSSVSARAQADTGLLASPPALRPRTDDGPAAARNAAARAAVSGRRGQRGAERVVHVQIGRLEVHAASTERLPGSGRPARTERRAPSLSLADYLARGEGAGR